MYRASLVAAPWRCDGTIGVAEDRPCVSGRQSVTHRLSDALCRGCNLVKDAMNGLDGRQECLCIVVQGYPAENLEKNLKYACLALFTAFYFVSSLTRALSSSSK